MANFNHVDGVITGVDTNILEMIGLSCYRLERRSFSIVRRIDDSFGKHLQFRGDF